LDESADAFFPVFARRAPDELRFVALEAFVLPFVLPFKLDF